METNNILEKMGDELRETIPSAMEARILLLAPTSKSISAPFQCILYNRPVNCISCNADFFLFGRSKKRFGCI
jgi:hypothetical protein